MSISKSISSELLKIISQAVNNRIYGSVEIYFENGKIVQVTQRVIHKIHHPSKSDQSPSSSESLRTSSSNETISSKV